MSFSLVLLRYHLPTYNRMVINLKSQSVRNLLVLLTLTSFASVHRIPICLPQRYDMLKPTTFHISF